MVAWLIVISEIIRHYRNIIWNRKNNVLKAAIKSTYTSFIPGKIFLSPNISSYSFWST